MDWIVGLGSNLFQGLVVGTLTFSLGEEIGWRGYLLPKLAAALGPERGMALTGLLHSAHNTFWALLASMTVAASPLAAEYLAGETGLLAVLGYGLVVIWLRPRLRLGERGAGAARPAPALTRL
jgi:uncharacterized protein